MQTISLTAIAEHFVFLLFRYFRRLYPLARPLSLQTGKNWRSVMKKSGRKKMWKLIIVVIWIAFLFGSSIGCFYLQKADVYKRAGTELADQAEIVSGQFSNLVETNFYTRAVLFERLLSEVKAVSFALKDYDDIEDAGAFLNELISTTEINNLWVYDRSGNMVFGSGGIPDEMVEPQLIPAILDSRDYLDIETNSFNEDDKYLTTVHLLDDDRNSLYWGVNDKWLIYVEDIFPYALREAAGFYNWGRALQDISIGRNGTMLAVSLISGNVLSFSDPDVKGKPVEDLNIKIAGKNEVLSAVRLLEEFEEPGEVKEIEAASVRYYATRMAIEDDLFLMMFPSKAIYDEIIGEMIILMLPVALLTGIGVLYMFCLAAAGEQQSQSGDEKKRKHLVPVGKLKVFAILAGLLVFILSLYLETHLVYSRMFQYTSTTTEDVMQKKNDADKNLKVIQIWVDEGNLEKSRIAGCIIKHAGHERADRQYISDLAVNLNVDRLYLFNSRGKVSVTNAPYDGMVIDKDSPLHALLEGEDSVNLQPVQSGDSATVRQEAGVTMIDENNRVSGAVVIQDDVYARISDSMSFETVFERVFLKDRTVVMAVDSENMKVRYFAQVNGSLLVSDQFAFDYTETDIEALGVDKNMIRDHFNGELFAIDNQFFASIRRNDSAFLMVLRPLVFIDTANFLSVLYATAAAMLFFILLILAAGTLKMDPAENSGTKDQQAAGSQSPDCSLPDKGSDKDEDDVIALLGSLTYTDKPYFKERWPSDGKRWKVKTPIEKFAAAVRLICILTLVLLALYVAIAGKSSVFYYSFNGEWSNGINLYSITSCIICIIILVLLKEIVHKVLYLIARAAQRRGETICHLLNSFTGYILFIVGVFMVLGTLGVNIAAMSLTAGVAGIIFGIGCQNIVADILAGIIMTFEGVACVGDFVSYNGNLGVIQTIGVRTTTLKWFSEVTVVRNNEFKNFINMPGKERARVLATLSIDIHESLSHVESILDEELPRIGENLTAIMGEEIKAPNYRGIQNIGDGEIKLSFSAYCKATSFGVVKRMLNRELVLMCERRGIRLAMQHIVVSEPAERS